MSVADKLKAVSPPYSKSEVNVIAEAAYNILYGVVLLTNQEKQYFKQHKKDIQILVGDYDLVRKKSLLTNQFVDSIKAAALRHLDG